MSHTEWNVLQLTYVFCGKEKEEWDICKWLLELKDFHRTTGNEVLIIRSMFKAYSYWTAETTTMRMVQICQEKSEGHIPQKNAVTH